MRVNENIGVDGNHPEKAGRKELAKRQPQLLWIWPCATAHHPSLRSSSYGLTMPRTHKYGNADGRFGSMK